MSYLKLFLSVDNYCILYEGKILYDLKSRLNLVNKNKKSSFNKSIHEWLSISENWSIKLYNIPVAIKKIVDSYFYCYYLIPRNKIVVNPTISKYASYYLLNHLNDNISNMLINLVKNLSQKYIILTDIDKIGGIYFGEIYNHYPEILTANYSQLVEINMFQVFLKVLHINLDKFNKPVIVLSISHYIVAYDISELIKNKSIPVVLLGP